MICIQSKAARRSVTAFALIAIAFVMVCGYAVARFRSTSGHPLRQVEYTQWIRASGDPSHAGYFRKRFDLAEPVQHAWIKVAASDAFEVSVNRNPLGRQYLWRPTRPFQNGGSEKGQVLSPKDPAMALNFPREYQWSGHDNWRLPTYIELTSAFQVGKNVITVEAESRRAPARVTFEGEIHLASGRVIPIRSDESWRGEPAIPGPQLLDWTDPYYWDKEWRSAFLATGPADYGQRSHPEQLYSEPFNGDWLRHSAASTDGAVTFSGTMKVDGPIDEAWLRLLTNRNYELSINGAAVRVASNKAPDMDNGDWVFGYASAHDPTAKPELLDPDEVGASFVGKRFESPRNAAPGLNEFIHPFSPQITPFRYERTNHRAQDGGVFEPKRTLAESRRTPVTPEMYPERPRPNSLKRDLSSGGYLSYSVASLLRPGVNQIQVRCLAKANAIWPVQVAIDGGAITSDGRRRDFVAGDHWTADDGSAKQFAIVAGPANVVGKRLPRMQYRGNALCTESFGQLLQRSLLQIALVTLLATCFILAVAWWIGQRGQDASGDDAHKDTANEDEVPLWLSTCQMLYAMLLTATVTIGAGLMLQSSWAERHEILWFVDGSMWRWIFLAAVIGSLSIGALDTLGRLGLSRLKERGQSYTSLLRDLPNTRLWFHLIIWVLLLGTLARAYKADLQPMDDDEYASVQAVVSILETGAPAFEAEDVYYTRSPLFHYVTAAIAWATGANLWALRMQSVFWSMATAWLTYLCGSRLLRSRWVGLIAMLLIAVHPFEIFTGHVIRFYQMQQFFALLTMYCFCRGFVTNQSQRYRVITMIVFLCAVLSQEITVAMGPSLLLCYLMFAKDFGWRRNIQLGLFCIMVIAVIGLDFVVFQNLCLTRTEGVSPSIEAAVKPHFWYPLNFLSIFIGYSRLHIVPSLFLLAGIPLICREKNLNALAFLAFLLSGVAMANVLVTNVSLRYLYWLFPVWALLSVNGMRLVLSALVSIVYPQNKNLNRYVVTLGVCCTICTSCILASWSLWRVPDSYEHRILGDSTGAVRWIRSQKRPGDRIAITEPHTHCAFIEGGKCDYDIAIPLLYDFAVMRDGVLVDRNGAGEVISSLDQLIGVFAKGERVWIALNREKFRTRGKNMRWEYPGARFETFIRKNCELKHRTYLWSVYVWHPARGHYQPFQLQE